jgi:hypothetical protein
MIRVASLRSALRGTRFSSHYQQQTLQIMEQKYFCTYKNASTNGAWIKSREYDTVAALFAAMMPYIEQHPTTTVQYQHTR